MKTPWSILICLLLAGFAGSAQTNLAVAPVPPLSSIAVSIVYDGSGSMRDPVPGADGQPTAKYLIANKAVNAIVQQLLAYSQEKQVEVQAGLVHFVGGKISEPIALTALTPKSAKGFAKWTRKFNDPDGGTPLGRAIQRAEKQLAESHCVRQHILVITDGLSNAGISPQKVLHQLRNGDHPIPVYFVAFDVAAEVFNPVKAEGATVVCASDETQLNAQLNTILGQKILLEAE